jgi:hypothetical protein
MPKKSSKEARQAEARARAALFMAIGEFIFEFSQLEFTIRHLVGDALNLKDHARFDIVTSPYDFATLCRVASKLVQSFEDCDEALREDVERTFNRCLALNDDRVRIAHGTWTIRGGARHVARSTLKASEYFTTPDAIQEKADQARRLTSSVVDILIGRPSEWPESSKRLSES